MLLYSCIGPKHLEDDEYLLYNQSIKGNEHIPDSELENQLIQETNQKLFVRGLYPRVSFYRLGKKFYKKEKLEKEKEKIRQKYERKINNAEDSTRVLELLQKEQKKLDKVEKKIEQGNWLMRVAGNPPVLYDFDYAEESRQQMQLKVRKNGYFNGTVLLEVDSNTKKQHASVTYTVEEGKPYRINEVFYESLDETVLNIILSDTSNSEVEVGSNYSEQSIIDERERLTSLLRDSGYYDFRKQYITIENDSTVGERKINIYFQILPPEKDSLHQRFVVDSIYVTVNLDNGRPAPTFQTIDYEKILFQYSENKYSPKVLKSNIFVDEGQFYSQDLSSQTQRALSRLDVFKFVGINYRLNSDSTLIAHIKATPLKKYTITDEYGIITTVSQGLPGPIVSVSLRNNNVFRGCEVFNISGRLAYEGQAAFTNEQQNYSNYARDISTTAALTFPQILLPGKWRFRLNKNRPQTRLQTSYNFNSRPEFQRTNINATAIYSVQPSDIELYSLSLIDLNLVNTSNLSPGFNEYLLTLRSQGNNLIESFDQSLISSVGVSYTYNSFNPTLNKLARYYRISLESGGTSLNILDDAFLANNDRIFGLQYFQFVRIQTDVRRYWPIGKKNTLVGRINASTGIPYGANNTLPYEKFFFSGGSNSNRAWRPRRLGPGSYTPDVDNDGELEYRFEQPGEILLETNLEYRFFLMRFIDLALFIDAGNVWTYDENNNTPGSQFESEDFFREIAIGSGIGIRLDFSFLILRFDVGTKLRNPALPRGERWTFQNLKFGEFFTQEEQTLVNIGIGYPF